LIFSALNLKTLIVQISERAHERFPHSSSFQHLKRKPFKASDLSVTALGRGEAGEKRQDDIRNSCRYKLIMKK